MPKIRQHKLFATLAFLLFSNVASANYDCNELIGSWSNEHYENEKLARRMIETISEDGKFWLKFILNDENITEYEQQGTWECDRDFLIISINESRGRKVNYVTAYKILEITNTTYRLRTCANTNSDCTGTTYNYFKVIN